MRLILTGCEYSGTSTLAYAITKWARSVRGGDFGFHDHWKIPHISHPPYKTQEESYGRFSAWAEGCGEDPTEVGLTDEEQKQFLALTPNIKEMFQRYHMDYHLQPAFYSYDHFNVVGMHIDEAVYAGLYYGYGGDGQYANRKVMARHIEERILVLAPDTVHILLKCTPEVIRERMKEHPHKNGLLQDKDVEFVLQRFEEEYDRSLIKNKFAIDTSAATVEQCLAEFVENMEPLLTDADRTRILVHKAKQKGEWVC